MNARLPLALAVVSALVTPTVASAAPLRLEEAVQLALRHNERAIKAGLRVTAAEGQVTRARASFLPSLTLNGGGGLDSQPDRSGRRLNGSGNLTLNQPLLNPPAIPLLKQARRQLESERWSAIEDRRLVAFETARAFLVVLMTEQVLEAARQRLIRARANQHNTEVRARAQITSTNDVTRALVETAAAAREVAQAEGHLATTYLQLGFLVGRNVAGPLAEPEQTIQRARTSRFSPDQMVRFAEKRRPDVRAAEERTRALRLSADEPLYRLAPTVGASAQVSVASGAVPPDPYHNESLQLNLSWTLFDAGVRYGDRKTRLAQAESQALDERLLRRSVATEIGVALATLKAARETYRISEDAVKAATRNTSETELLYQQGLARAIELIDANARRFEAEVGRASAKLAMEQAYLELRLALGLDPVGRDPGRQPAGEVRR